MLYFSRFRASDSYLAFTAAANGDLLPQREVKSAAEVESLRKGNRASAAGFRAVVRALTESSVRNGLLVHEGRVLTSERLRDQQAVALQKPQGGLQCVAVAPQLRLKPQHSRHDAAHPAIRNFRSQMRRHLFRRCEKPQSSHGENLPQNRMEGEGETLVPQWFLKLVLRDDDLLCVCSPLRATGFNPPDIETDS